MLDRAAIATGIIMSSVAMSFNEGSRSSDGHLDLSLVAQYTFALKKLRLQRAGFAKVRHGQRRSQQLAICKYAGRM